MSKKTHEIKNDMDPFANIFYYDNSEAQEDQKRLQGTTEQLKRDLAKAHEEIDRIYSVLKNNNSTLNSATGTQIPDLLTATGTMNNIAPTQVYKSISQSDPTDHVMQAKLAKELIKLANSCKVPELTFDVKASKRDHKDANNLIHVPTNCLSYPE